MRLVIELKILPVDKVGVGVTTYLDAARALRALTSKFEAEALGGELEHELKSKHNGGTVEASPWHSTVVGSWKVVRR